jgi:hypothetical protein
MPVRLSSASPEPAAKPAYMWKVTPKPLKSLTRSTELMTSCARSSKQSTFHIGTPSAVMRGAVGARNPLLCVSSFSDTASLRLRTFLSDAARRQNSTRLQVNFPSALRLTNLTLTQ